MNVGRGRKSASAIGGVMTAGRRGVAAAAAADDPRAIDKPIRGITDVHAASPEAVTQPYTSHRDT